MLFASVYYLLSRLLKITALLETQMLIKNLILNVVK